jgi:hypothetical protein
MDASRCSECRELEDVNGKLAETAQLTRILKTQRAAVLARRNTRNDFLCTKLPDEVVCRVFEEYIKSHLSI